MIDTAGVGRTVYHGFLQAGSVSPLRWFEGPGYHKYTRNALGRGGELRVCNVFVAPECPPAPRTGATFRFRVFDGGCGIAFDNAIYCYSFDGFRPLAEALHFGTLGAGFYNACAVSVESVVYCWGVNPVVGLEPLGVPDVQWSEVPLPVFSPE